MFCNQSCLAKGRKQLHASEWGKIRDQMVEAFEIPDVLGSELGFGTHFKHVLQALTFAGSVERLRELVETSERKTIFDFDLRGQDDQSKDLIYLKIINSLQESSRDALEFVAGMFADQYFDAIDLKPFVKSEADKKYLKEYLIRFILCGIRNFFAFDDRERGNGCTYQPFGTLFNHSCNPNIFNVFMENKGVYIVSLPIKKGDQLFICYNR